jgi:hypothetical protein
MPQWLAATLRWTVTLAVGVGAFVMLGPLVLQNLGDAVGFGQQQELPELEQAAGPPPLRAGRAEATITAGTSLGAIETLEGPIVSVGQVGVDTLLIGFEPLPTDPACLVGAALEVHLQQGVETPVHVLPARVDNLGDLGDGHPLAADYLLTRRNPSTAYTTGAGGWLRFQVRGTYQLAARAATAGSPVVFAVRLPPEAGDQDLVTFSTVAHRAPRLRWSAVDSCATEHSAGEAMPAPVSPTPSPDAFSAR